MRLTDVERRAASLTRTQYRALGMEIARVRTDAGISQRELARVARVSQGFLCHIEAGDAKPSFEALNRIAAALGADLSLRLYPNTGPAIRDRHQARMLEALLRILHPRWHPNLEVPVRRPARGVIDCVLDDRSSPVVVAVEAESDVRRLEQQLRWATEKAASLPSADLWPFLSGGDRPRQIGQLILLRSTQASRAVVNALPHTFETAFPADPAGIRLALTTADAAWPGNGLLWVGVDGGARILERRPPGVR